MENIEAVRQILIHKEKVEFSLREIQRILNTLISENQIDLTPNVSEEKIFYAIEQVFGFTKDQVLAQNRSRKNVLIRNAAIYFFKEYRGYYRSQIARIFGRDRVTIMNSLSVFEADYNSNLEYSEKVEAARKIIIE